MELTPEIMQEVAKLGEGYLTYLYVELGVCTALIIGIFGVLVYAVKRMTN